MPKDHRQEEEYLYKYFSMRGPKAKKLKAEEDAEGDEDGEEDPEMEKFANDIIEKEMRKMNK